MKVNTEIDNNFGYEKITQLVDNIPLRWNLHITNMVIGSRIIWKRLFNFCCLLLENEVWFNYLSSELQWVKYQNIFNLLSKRWICLWLCRNILSLWFNMIRCSSLLVYCMCLWLRHIINIAIITHVWTEVSSLSKEINFIRFFSIVNKHITSKTRWKKQHSIRNPYMQDKCTCPLTHLVW